MISIVESNSAANKREARLKIEIASGLGSIVHSFFLLRPVHEGGHFIAAKLLGYEATIDDYLSSVYNLEGYVNYRIIGEYSRLEDNLLLLGGSAAEYAFAAALSLVSRRIKSPLLKTAVKTASVVAGFGPFFYSATSHFGLGSDYERLADNGIGYEITVPATFILGLANAYFALRGNHQRSSPKHSP